MERRQDIQPYLAERPDVSGKTHSPIARVVCTAVITEPDAEKQDDSVFNVKIVVLFRVGAVPFREFWMLLGVFFSVLIH